MLLEEINSYKELGIAVVSIIIIYSYSKWVGANTFTQVENANKRAEDAHKEFKEFVESTYKENTNAITRLVTTFEEHVRAKDKTLEMLEKRHEELINNARKS